jgi:hypothetical protein
MAGQQHHEQDRQREVDQQPGMQPELEASLQGKFAASLAERLDPLDRGMHSNWGLLS